MKRVSVNGISYSLPFEHLLRPLAPWEWSGLAASVETHGVLSPVTIAKTPSWGRCLLDGMHRATIAERLDLDVPTTNKGDITDAKARELALSLNLDRRHSTPEEQQAARAGRIVRVTAARAIGESLATIAKSEDVSIAQVRRDLQDAEQNVPGGTMVAPPPQIVATDGRVYSVARTRPRQSVAQQTHRGADSLVGLVRKLLKSTKRGTLEAIARQHGVPLDGSTWPALDAIRAVLRDVAQGGVSA